MRICHPGEEILPVLQAGSLDIERAQTHTDLMLTCRMGALYRMLTLLGLVLAFVVVASNGWAQFLVEGGEAVDKYTQYPFLGVDATQRNMLINAFNFQSRIFSMMSGAGQDSVEAFNILAMLGALVGALMLFFNAKIRKPMIVGPWLIVLILLVFAPYGSKLLFYPVSQQSLDTLFESLDNGAGGRESISPQDCVATPEACGFSPQIAGIHIASTLQMLFSDAFRSAGWVGLMEGMRSSDNVKNSKYMAIPDPVVQSLNDFSTQCGMPISSIVEEMGAVNRNTLAKTRPTQFLYEWNKIINALKTSDSTFSVPPRAIQLWGDVSFTTVSAQWSSEAKQLYVDGLGQLFRGISGESRAVLINGCNENCDGETSVSADYALAALDKNGFFQVTDGMTLLPGFFVYWDGAKNKDAGNEGVAFENVERFPAANARKCYRATGLHQSSGGIGVQDETAECLNNPILMPENQASFVINDLPASYGAYPWSILGGLLNPDSPVAKMPVAVRVYKEGPFNAGGSMSPAEVDTVFETVNCKEMGEHEVKNIVNLIVGPSGSINENSGNDDFSKVQRLLLDPASAPQNGRITLQDICNNYNDSVDINGECGVNTQTNYQTTEKAKDFEKIFDGVLRQNSAATPEQQQKLLLKVFLQHVEEASKRSRNNDSDVQKKADEDGSSPQVVGSRGLTWIGGGIASFLGQFIVGIGSLFVGPLAAAIIFFLTMLVDMSLMILIILTPFLLLAGLFVPGNAIGVLTVSIVGVFVLKFVPVTLIILNYLGAMIYAFLGFAADPASADTMQSMIIIAMGGMYASLVTMTFFLLFKMGDASAILSRFTALDSSAKEVAQRGMAATIALATSAALLGAGTLGALAGRATMGMAARKAAANLGIPPGWLDAAKMVTAETPNKDDKKGDGKSIDNDMAAVPEGELSEQARFGKDSPLEEIEGAGVAGEEVPGFMGDSQQSRYGNDGNLDAQSVIEGQPTKDAQEVARKRIDAAAAKNLAMSPAYGMTEPQANELIDTGSVTLEDGKQYSLSETNGVYGISEGQGVSSIAGKSVGETTQAANQISGSETVAPVVAGEGAQAVAGIPASVTIAGGSLDSITEVGRVQQATIEQTSMQERVSEIAAEKEAERQAAENKDAMTLANNQKLEPTQREQLSAIATELNGTTDEERRGELFKKQEEILQQSGKTKAGLKRDELLTRNMNDQIAEALVRFDKANGDDYIVADKKRKKGEALSAREKELVDIRDGLANFDTAGVAQGEIMSRLGTFESLNAALSARAGADNLPSYKASALSGLYGAFSGAGGGLAKIPVLGPAISESLNEFYQAPERARAAQAVGGGMAWWTAQGNAKRMGFYQKEMAPLAAAQQYDSMLAVGGFQAQADIARQAASEAVARSRSQWEAMVASRAPTLSMDLRNEILSRQPDISQQDLQAELSRKFNERINSPEFKVVMTSGELSGLGRMDAADKIASVRQEAYLMQGAALQVKRVKGGLDGNMMLKAGTTEGLNVETEEVGVILTPEALARVRGDLTTKAATKKYDDMMITHYGLTEKQYLRGDAQWDFSRNMNTSAAAAAMFSRKDISTDYLVGGHLNMVSGKERFLEGKAQYETLVKFRNETNNKIAEYVQNQLASAGGAVSSLLDKAGASSKVSNLTGQDYAVNARLELEKWAGKQMIKDNKYLPLNLIFDSATARGAASYELKAQKARSEMAAENAAVWESVDKARRAAINSMLGGLNSSAKKAAKTEWNGFNIEAGAPLEILTEWIDSALGTASEEVLGKLGKAIPAAMQDSFLRSEKKTITVDGKDYREVVSYMSKDAFAAWLRTMSDEQRKAILAEKKYYREANGRVELSRTVMDSEGNIREDLSHNR